MIAMRTGAIGTAGITGLRSGGNSDAKNIAIAVTITAADTMSLGRILITVTSLPLLTARANKIFAASKGGALLARRLFFAETSVLAH